MEYPTKWRIEDLHVGKVIYNPPMAEVDPVTRQSTGRLRKFIVSAPCDGGYTLVPYDGDQDAEMPPN